MVGIIVGGLAGGAGTLAAHVVPHVLAVAIVFGLSIVLTGAIHVDGFLDTCDAVFARVPPQRRLEILKDPRHGTFAISYFAVATALWLAALFALPIAGLEQNCALAAGSARFAAVLGALDRRPSPFILGLDAVLLAVLSVSISPWAWIVIVAIVVFALLQCTVLRRALSRLTGDAYGCTIVCSEIAALVALVFLPRP